MYYWSEMIEEHQHPRVRVEDLSDLTVTNDMMNHLIGKRMDRAKIAGAIGEVDTNVNTRRRDEAVTWADGGERLAELAERWGYEVSDA